jgi:hypothetical protein
MTLLKPYVLPLIAIIGLSACSKHSNSNAINYTVNALTDVTVAQYSDTTLIVPVGVAFVSGTQEQVTLTPTNLPSGVTVSPVSISGTPSYGNSFYFTISKNTVGTYPVTIVATAAATANKTYTFNIIVTPSSNCTPEITGTNWKYSTKCTSAPLFDTGFGYISVDPYYGTTSASVVDIRTISVTTGGNYEFLAGLICDSSTLVLEGVGGQSGTGTFSSNRVVETYTVSTGSGTNTCQTILTR